MEHLIKLKRLMDTVANTIINSMEESMNKTFILEKMDKMQQEIIEIEKIQNYTNVSVIPNKEKESPKEMVEHPTHYKGGKLECIDVMLDVFGKEKVSAFCELNAFKYQWRANSKGTNIQDKKKAIWYNRKYIELNKEKL